MTVNACLINSIKHYSSMIAPGIANQLAVLGLSVVPFYSNNTITYNGPYGPLLVQLGNLSP